MSWGLKAKCHGPVSWAQTLENCATDRSHGHRHWRTVLTGLMGTVSGELCYRQVSWAQTLENCADRSHGHRHWRTVLQTGLMGTDTGELC
jgi:hypothetical protein